FFPGKYQIFFMDGCDTFAYVDGALASTRAVLNPDDPLGTKYMDIVQNAMPAYFVSMADSSMALIRALKNDAAPQSYENIFAQIATSQVVVVTGEEDNAFSPGTGGKWLGGFETGAVTKGQMFAYETDTLPAGKYAFQLTPDTASPGGDADLRVKAGAEPAA